MKEKILTGALAALLTFGGLSTPVAADSQEILVDDVWARATIGVSRPAAVYFTLRNTGGDAVKLIGFETTIAKRAEAHRSKIDANGISTMEPAGEILLRPGNDLVFEPGGLHIMLMGLQEPLVEGDSIQLDLLFDDGGRMPVNVRVRGIAARGPRN
jgi:hypothetical protein